MPTPDDTLYLAVAKELTAGLRDEELWIKAFALEEGDETKTKAHYVRLRVEKLATPKRSSGGVEPESVAKISSPSSAVKKSVMPYVLVLLIVLAGIGLFKSTIFRNPGVERAGAKEEPPKIAIPSVEQKPGFTELDLLTAGIAVTESGSSINISLTGEITPVMSKYLKLVLDQEKFKGDNDFWFWLDSNGGDVYSAMEIGRAIRRKELSAVNVAENAVCYSSCVFILAAGEQRGRLGKIGIHRPYSLNPSESNEKTTQIFTKVSNDAKSYLREMRVRESLFDDMLAVPPDQIRIIKSEEDFRGYGLLAFDPVAEEKIAALQMKVCGITDRQIYMHRKQDAERACSGSFQHNGRNYTISECFEAFLSGALSVIRK